MRIETSNQSPPARDAAEPLTVFAVVQFVLILGTVGVVCCEVLKEALGLL